MSLMYAWPPGTGCMYSQFQSQLHTCTLTGTGYLDELWQVKRWFLYTSLPLQVLALETPVPRNWDRVTSGL